MSSFDFVSDEKEIKRKARVMIEMMEAINDTHLPKLGGSAETRLEAQCVTCHHGQSRPEALGGLLAKAMEEGGIEAAAAKYRELREEHYGSHSYDFSEGTVLGFAQELFRGGRADEAKAKEAVKKGARDRPRGPPPASGAGAPREQRVRR